MSPYPTKAFSIFQVKKTLLVTGTAVVSICVIALVLVFSIEAYHAREMRRHRVVLEKLLERRPTVTQLESEFHWDFYREAKPSDAKELAGFWDNRLNSPAEIDEKVTRWPQTRVYFNSPMVYFIYFDAQGVMRDFSVLSN